MFEYAPAPEPTAVDLAPAYGPFLDGRFEPADDARTPVLNPATGAVLTSVTPAGADDVDRAVRAAHRAQWAGLPGRDRARALLRLARLLQDRSRELAVVQTVETGLPVKESHDVVAAAITHVVTAAGWAEDPARLAPTLAGATGLPPRGVTGVLLPWHAPLLRLTRRVAPVLAAGGTVVLRPAPTAPLTALLVAEVAQQADLPPGVVNVLTGAGPDDADLTGTDPLGAAIAAHPGIGTVAFTGAPAGARAIARQVAGTGRHAVLDVPRPATHLVLDDAPIDQAVDGLVAGVVGAGGQVPGVRLLVQESMVDDVVNRLEDGLARVRVGDPSDRNTDLGPVHSAEQLDHLTRLVEDGAAAGASRWSPDGPQPEAGFWFPPTILAGVPPAHPAREVAGPVLSVLTFRTPQETVTTAGSHASSVVAWTEKGSRSLWLADRHGADLWANASPRLDAAVPAHWRPSAFAVPDAPDEAPVSPEPADVAESADRSASDDLGRRAPAAVPQATTPAPGPHRGSHPGVDAAVAAARAAQPGWASTSAQDRTVVLLRVAEMLEEHRPLLVAEVRAAEAVDAPAAEALVTAAVDRWTWYAGQTGRATALAGTVHPVAGPYLSVSVPRPAGVVAVLAPQGSSLLGLVHVLGAPLVTGNAVVVLAGEQGARPATALARVLAAADVPTGVVTVLTGRTSAVAPYLAGHPDVDVIDLGGAGRVRWADLEALAADHLTRVLRPAPGPEPSWSSGDPARIRAFTEPRTLCLPRGL